MITTLGSLKRFCKGQDKLVDTSKNSEGSHRRVGCRRKKRKITTGISTSPTCYTSNCPLVTHRPTLATDVFSLVPLRVLVVVFNWH